MAGESGGAMRWSRGSGLNGVGGRERGGSDNLGVAQPGVWNQQGGGTRLCNLMTTGSAGPQCCCF